MLRPVSHRKDILTETAENVLSDMCAQRRFRSACAFAQSDQNLHWAHFGLTRMWSFFLLKTKALISLRDCAGWFESSLGAHVRRYVFGRCRSYDCYNWQDIGKLGLSWKRLITDMMKEWYTAVAQRVVMKVFSFIIVFQNKLRLAPVSSN